MVLSRGKFGFVDARSELKLAALVIQKSVRENADRSCERYIRGSKSDWATADLNFAHGDVDVDCNSR